MQEALRSLPDGSTRPDEGERPELPNREVEASLKGDWGDARHVRENMRMIGQAIRKGWNIPDEALDQLPAEVLDIWKDRHIPLLVRMKALETYIKMYGQNLRSEATDQGVNVNIGVALQATQQETSGLTEEELDRVIDERIRVLAAIEAKSVSADG
jgi:hypothetical protein